jgi:nitric oxide reductase activation protein
MDLDDDDLPGIPSKGKALDPAPYLELEEKVRPHAARLAEALQEPQPDQRSAPHEYRGRYTFRQEIRTPDTPHLARQEMGQAARSLALYVLVDRSGSMDRFEQAVREALMTFYLAAIQVGIPIGIAYFGEDDFYTGDSPLTPDHITVEQVVAEVAPLSPNNHEPAKALIAGFSGWSCEEYLDWGLRKAEAELRTRPERLHVLIIIHDGEPIFHTCSISDWDLSLTHLRSLERSGVIPIGVHLGNENLEKLYKLFPRLVNCPNGESLPDKLGSMLSSLA